MKLRAGLSLAVLMALCALPSRGFAQDIYKYTKSDGTVVYTDNLGDLPKERRVHYNELKEKQEAAERELMQRLGKEEYERRKAEKEKQELMKARMDEGERKERINDVNVRLAVAKAAETKRNASKEYWTGRVAYARKRLKELQTQYRQAQADYSAIAMQPSYTRFPGQNKKLTVLKQNLIGLEGQIDQMIKELTQDIPDEARKAGIPPGWVR